MNTFTQRRAFLKHMTAVPASAVLAGRSWASKFPERPVTIVIPYAPGGATDSLIRSLIPSVSKSLDQPVLVENKPGASGLLGANQMMQASPAGYSLAILPEAAFRLPQLQKSAFDPLQDLSYITHIAGYAFGFAVHADTPWRSWRDFVADARKRPGKINYGSAGLYSTMHFTMEELMQKAGIELNHIPYKGEADIVASLLGRHVDVGTASGPLTPHVASGKLRILHMWSAKRTKRYPDIPTLHDLGYAMESMAPFGLVGPRNMDPAVVKVLHDAFHKALHLPEGQAALERVDLENAYLNSADYARFAREQFERQRQLIERLKIRPNA